MVNLFNSFSILILSLGNWLFYREYRKMKEHISLMTGNMVAINTYINNRIKESMSEDEYENLIREAISKIPIEQNEIDKFIKKTLREGKNGMGKD